MRNFLTVSSALLSIGFASAVFAQASYSTNDTPGVEINLEALDKRSRDIYLPQASQPVRRAEQAPAAPATKGQPVAAVPSPAPLPDQGTALSTDPVRASQQGSPYSPFKANGYVEAGGNYSHLNNNYNSWAGQYVKGEIQTDPHNRWSAELINQREFGDTGQYGVLGNTHEFNENWYSIVNLGLGNDAFFLPRFRADVFINRKLLKDKSLVATLGYGYSKAQDTYDDNSLFVGATYYFPRRWIVQGGVRYNYSNPGGVDSTSGFVALTEGEYQKHFITARYGFGREAYQIIGPSTAISDFESHIVSLDWRQWVAKQWGFDLRGEYYHNPNYDRNGVNFGVFHEF